MPEAEERAPERPAPRRVPAGQRVANDPAYVLHTRPWKETSLVLELLTRSHGRVIAVAKGARRPASQLRPVLMLFQPLLVTWAGRSEVRTIHAVKWVGGIPQLGGVALMCGFYLNELLVKALAREDPHEGVFDAYAGTVRDLATDRFHTGILRRFEAALLADLGYGLQLESDAESGADLLLDRWYRYLPERGAIPLMAGEEPDGATVRGKTLLDIARSDYTDPVTASEAKRLMRLLLQHHLGDTELHARQLVMELRET